MTATVEEQRREYRQDILQQCPEEAQPIIGILLQHEDHLSDGYGYYCRTGNAHSNRAAIAQELTGIAQEILALEKT